MIFIAGCSQQQVKIIDVSQDLQSCTVYSDKISCVSSDGNVYYVSNIRISQITKYDKSAWKENVNYCPPNVNLSGNVTEQCKYKKICWNEQWVEY
jgi:hypothetical protein